MSTATIRELRTSFPKIRARLDRIDYYARLLSYMPKPMSAAGERALDADRDDR